MSKELEALEFIKTLPHANGGIVGIYTNKWDIIEQGLKELEQLRKLKLLPYPKENDEEYRQGIIKKLMALEILKAFDFEIEDYTEYEHGCIKVKCNRIIIDDEEIDLLKEVLL